VNDKSENVTPNDESALEELVREAGEVLVSPRLEHFEQLRSEVFSRLAVTRRRPLPSDRHSASGADSRENLTDKHREKVGRRGAARAARSIVWTRRLQRINAALVAAAVLMLLQFSSSMIALARLESVAADVPEVVRLTLP